MGIERKSAMEFVRTNRLKSVLALAIIAGTGFDQTKVRAAATIAAAQKLTVGDPAPVLQTGKWIQGTPVKEFSRDNAYLVEFWATWCAPCRASIPHLNEIYNHYKDKGLVVIGQDCREQNEWLPLRFVKKMGTNMAYPVALDDTSEDSKGSMMENWMAAAGMNGIPTAFLINKEGKIAWIGEPMSLRAGMIDKVLDGTYDLNKAAEDYAKAQERQRETEAKLYELPKLLAAFSKEWSDGNISKVSIVHVDSHATYQIEYSAEALENHPEFALVVRDPKHEQFTRNLVAEIGKLKVRPWDYQDDALRWGFIFTNEKGERVLSIFLDKVAHRGLSTARTFI